MAPSFLLLIFIAYGMATYNPWFQFGGIFIVLAIQMGYQIYRSAKSSPIIKLNIQEAARAKRSKPLLYMTEHDVNVIKADAKSLGEWRQLAKMLSILMLPAAILLGTTYMIGAFWPDVPSWQSFVAGFLISMAASTALASKVGLSSGFAYAPSSYLITERGIVFEHMGRSFVLKFPLKRLTVKDRNIVEVEGDSETPIIPNILRLYTKNTDELIRILNPRTKLE
jgi:uncharacterized membrane protein